MKQGFTDIPNELLEAVLRFRCPNGYKEVILALMRLTYGSGQREGAVSVLRLSRFINQDKSNTAKRLRELIRCKVVKETARPT
ncbi:MAG: replication protein, partial [Acidobacteriota bacterium]